MIIKHGRHICLRNSQGAQRFVGFFLDCAFRMLIGWAGRSRGSEAGWDKCQESDAEMAVVGKAEVRIENLKLQSTITTAACCKASLPGLLIM